MTVPGSPASSTVVPPIGRIARGNSAHEPASWRKTLRTTNSIESVFDTVRTSCGNVKRWRPRDQRERWICAGLRFAGHKFRRIDGYRELSRFLDIIDARLNSSKVMRQTA